MFVVGAFSLIVNTTLPFLWALLGMPDGYPLNPTHGWLVVIQVLTPPIGAFLLVAGALIYGRRKATP